MSNIKNNMGSCNAGDYNTGSCNTGSCNAGDYNTGSCNTGSCNTGSCNTGSCNAGDYNTGYRNTGYRNAGDYNTGSCNTGSCNAGDYNTGYFNSNAPKVRIFNKDSDLEFDSEIIFELRVLIYRNLKAVCTWIAEGQMTDKEKEENQSYKITGGYLKKRDYKYCWAKFWEKITQGDKDFIKSLPNFDPIVFEKITGIKIDQQKKSVTLELTEEQLEQITKLLNE